jgi:outer membrane protein assembly factor BamA
VLGLLVSLTVVAPDCARLPSPPAVIPLSEGNGLSLYCIDIEIDGAVRRDAVERALRLREGSIFDAEIWQSDVQTLANLGFFRRLDTELLAMDSRGVALRLHVKTAWSLLPFLAYEGGPVPIAIVGAYYANIAGEMLDGGAYYMRRGPYDLGRAWLTLPHWPLPRALVDLQLVFTGELRPDYEAPEWRIPTRGIEVMRRGGFLDIGVTPVADLLTLSLRYSLLRETTVTLENLHEVVSADIANRSPPELERGDEHNAWLSLLSATVLVGQVDLVDNFLFRGHELRAVALASTDALGSARDFGLFYLSYRSFIDLTSASQMALRLTAGHSTSANPNDDFVVGGHNLEPFVYNSKLPGLLTVRGVRPGTFHGQELAVANVEPRYTLLRDFDAPAIGGVSLQLAAFMDVGRAWTGDLPSDRRSLAWVAGAGVLWTLLEFRYTYVNWYVARVIEPLPETVLNVVVTRPFF